ncbi:uncharacterized protein PV07_08902 [Cladophialophora immunda]|uniref:DUF7924 domain-containing protein n=1 Tax=Cladophialophora immunda TaxID=569365 RepID=A0A0D2AL54_9EURO|nr:uncharacterized protein PV07_08902 [Cladophialophora immunda]KIW25747.1 hypothetical protein PV07_08902 [Cladophialophora immunda]
MSVALRGIVDLHRRANRVSEVHQRALGFLIFSDDSNAVVSVHYPEIDAQDTASYWRDNFVLIKFKRKADRRACGQLALQVCQIFAPILLKQLTSVIDELPDLAEVDNDGGGNSPVSGEEAAPLEAAGQSILVSG